jgi:hypothetical protein
VNTTALLVALYPPPVRERWGDDLSREIASGGPRSWPDTIVGAVWLWTRPSDWPERAPGQTRRLVLVELAAAATFVALLLRAAGQPTARFTVSFDHPVTSAWAAVIVAGFLLAAPLPPRWAAVRRLPAVFLRTLAAPAAAFTAMYLLAHSGLSAHPADVGRYLAPCYYWATLAFIGLRLCRLARRVFALVAPPSTPRLSLATLLVAIGLALAAAQNLASEPASSGRAALSVGLGGIAIAALATSRDLRRVARQDGGG